MTAQYDTEAIRELLTDSFSAAELDNLCFDHFREVYEQYTPEMDRPARIQRLIEYCDRRGQFEKLLDVIEKVRPLLDIESVISLSETPEDSVSETKDASGVGEATHTTYSEELFVNRNKSLKNC